MKIEQATEVVSPSNLLLDNSPSNHKISINFSTTATEKQASYQRRSSKQKLTFIFKPPRVSNEQYSEVPYKMKDDKISKNTAIKELPITTEQEGGSNMQKRNSSTNRITISQDKHIPHINQKNTKIESNQIQNSIGYIDNVNTNFLSIKKDKSNLNNNSNTNIVESFRRISDNPLLSAEDDQQFNQSFLNETPHAQNTFKSSFDQFAEETTTISTFQPKKIEIKTNFVSHSTDFAFITQLLELKSKASENLKIYNENRAIQSIRSMLSDERILKKTILNLSKTTFGAFYDCLQHTLESSDLFFHLTNKLKNMVNAIIKIHLQHEITDAFQIIIKETCKVLECDRASVFMVNSQTQELWTKIAKGSGVIKVPFGQGLVGFVANTMKPLNILDAHKDSRFNPEIDKKSNYHTKSVLCVPVIDQDKGNLVGVMQAINKKDGFFTKDDEGCLQIMAQHAMNVLRNSISHDEKQKNQSMVKNLLHISIKLSKCATIERLVIQGRNMISQYLDVNEFKLYLLDQQNNKIFSLNESEDDKVEFESNCGLIGYAIQMKQDLMIDNAYNHTNFNQLIDINTSMPLSMYLIWDNPKKKNQILGVVQVINQNGIHNIGKTSKSSIKFDAHLKLFCEIVGSQIKKFYKILKENQNNNTENIVKQTNLNACQQQDDEQIKDQQNNSQEQETIN